MAEAIWYLNKEGKEDIKIAIEQIKTGKTPNGYVKLCVDPKYPHFSLDFLQATVIKALANTASKGSTS